jgi:uncharacterized protein (TIGR04255 family)
MTEFKAQQITLSDAGAEVRPAGELDFVGVTFDALKRDGSIDWRLRLQQNYIAVNCLSYTRWDQVWPTSRDFLQQVCEILVKPDLPVIGMALQYVDVFLWDGDIKEYRADQLLRKESDHIPSAIFNRGPVWHLYQGWFEYADLPIEGRRLEKVHIDAVERGSAHATKVDMTLRHDLKDRLPSAGDVFHSERGEAPVDTVFTSMHTECKRLLRAFISDQMVERISLDT